MFQLRPKTSALMTGGALATSIFSYAVVNLLFEQEFPAAESGVFIHTAARYTASFGMDLYHALGIFHFYELLYSVFTPNEREQFLFAMEKIIASFKNKTLEQFVDFVENDPTAATLHLMQYPNPGYVFARNETKPFISPKSSDIILEIDDEVTDPTPPTSLPQTSRSLWSCFGLFGGATTSTSSAPAPDLPRP